MPGLLVTLALMTQAAGPPPATASPRPGAFLLPKVVCPPDPAAEQQLLALSFREFDQDPVRGWRLYALNGCHRDAARLIARYAEKIDDPRARSGLKWHEFQMLAFADDVRGALAALSEVKRADAARQADSGWKLYVAGSEAFIEGRRRDLQKHIADLAAFADQQGPTAKIARLNGNVLQGLLRCFGKPYKVAYTAPCADMEAARAIAR